MNKITVFCPATIANVSCGFDVLGLCLKNIGDIMTFKLSQKKGVKITKVYGADLPLKTEKNVAGVAGTALLDKLNPNQGIDIEIFKKIKAGSGIGSSAASSSGAVFGINQLFGQPFSNYELIEFAMKGEELACGTEHADNVAPAILGGFTLVRSSHPLDVISLPVPKALYASIIHPQIEVRTEDARAILKNMILLKDAITQWGNLAAFISSLYTEDYNLMSRSMVDSIVEPERSILIPYYHNVKLSAIEAGALGSSISGSGPSIFALSNGKETAEKVLKAMSEVFDKTDIEYDAHLSEVAATGTCVIK